MIWNGVAEMGLTTLTEKGYESPTITAVVTPEGVTGIQVYEAMRERNFELAKGYGAVKEKTFRIGNMGYIPFEDIQEMHKYRNTNTETFIIVCIHARKYGYYNHIY